MTDWRILNELFKLKASRDCSQNKVYIKHSPKKSNLKLDENFETGTSLVLLMTKQQHNTTLRRKFLISANHLKITQNKPITIPHLNLGSILFLWSSIILFVSNFIWRTVMALISLPFTCTMRWEHRPSGKNNLRFTKGCTSSSMPDAHAGPLTVEKKYRENSQT